MTVLDHPLRHVGADPGPPPLGRALVELDPCELLDNPLNPRADVGDVSTEAASMRECGVLEPLIVVPIEVDGDARHMILFGHRRRAAAIEAGLGTVPCDVRPEYADRQPEQLADMLVENLHRRELSGVEEAGGYAQLSMFDGWTPERIARRLGRPVDRVRAGLAAADVGERLRPQVVDGSVTLEQAAAIEEFADDEKAYARLLRAASYPAGLHHLIAEERHRHSVEERKVATRTALRDAGVRVIARPKEYPYGSVEARVEDLTDGDGQHLTAEGHAGCPGHAAFIDANSGDAVFLCQHPKDWGHGTSPSYRHLSRAEVQAAAEAADARREYETSLAIADDARRSFLTEYLARRGRPPAGTLRIAVTILCRYGATAGTRAAAALLLSTAGSDADPRDTGPAEAALVDAVDRSAENWLPFFALAYAAAAGEQNLTARGRWSFDPAFAVHWLNVLTELGYPITDAEAQLRDHAQQQLLDVAAEDDDEDLPNAAGGLVETAPEAD